MKIFGLLSELITSQLVLPVPNSHTRLELAGNRVQEFLNSSKCTSKSGNRSSSCSSSISDTSCSSCSESCSNSCSSNRVGNLEIVRLQLPGTSCPLLVEDLFSSLPLKITVSTSRFNCSASILLPFRCTTTFAPGLDISNARGGWHLVLPAPKDGRPTKPLMS